jgi:hypothetical protein
MALKFIDGFDHYAATTESAANIAAYLTAAGYTVANAAANKLNIVAGQDAGSVGIKLTIDAGSATPPNFSYPITTNADKIVFGFSFRGNTSRVRICRLNGVVDLLWDATTGKLAIGSVLGADVIILNAFWYIELVVNKATNKIQVYANDALQLETDLPGGAVTNSHVIQWGLTGANATAATVEIDDFYVADNGGGTVVDRCGPMQVITRAPTSDVTTEWTPVNSTGSHASIAAQLSPNTANAPYLQANLEGKTDRFTSNTVLPNDNVIFGVQTVAYAKKGDLDNRALGMLVKTTAGELEQQVALATSYGYKTTMFEQAPGNIAWNQNRVESSQFGIVAR